MMIFSRDYNKLYIDTLAVEAEWKYSVLNLAESERPLRIDSSVGTVTGDRRV